mmetsp:Transcript_12819/g.51512  ORF Transcript_12819/g.51512 Transcript_12819/m.51512 type:complete len:93 (-) Transcript_12819:7-285(-)
MSASGKPKGVIDSPDFYTAVKRTENTRFVPGANVVKSDSSHPRPLGSPSRDAEKRQVVTRDGKQTAKRNTTRSCLASSIRLTNGIDAQHVGG